MQIRFQGVTISHKSPDEHSKGSVLIKVVRNEVFQGVKVIDAEGNEKGSTGKTYEADRFSDLVGQGLDIKLKHSDPILERPDLCNRFVHLVAHEAPLLGAIRYSYLNVVEKAFDSPTNEKILVSQTPADPANGTPESVSFEFLA